MNDLDFAVNCGGCGKGFMFSNRVHDCTNDYNPITKFYDYFTDFYDLETDKPVYTGITRDILETATDIYINNGTVWADGDSVDRERILELIMVLHGSTVVYNGRTK